MKNIDLEKSKQKHMIIKQEKEKKIRDLFKKEYKKVILGYSDKDLDNKIKD